MHHIATAMVVGATFCGIQPRVAEAQSAELFVPPIIVTSGRQTVSNYEGEPNPAGGVEPGEIEVPNAKPADAEQDPLLTLVDQAINTTSRRKLSAEVHTPWQIFHGLLAYRENFEISQDGQKISILDWLANDCTYKNEKLFQITPHGGRLHPYSVPYAFEGHANQFLAILSMSNLPEGYEVKVGDQKLTFADLVQNSKMELNVRDETTFSLWALSRVLSPDAEWTNEKGEYCSIEQLVREETNLSLRSAACGGSHCLFALGCAINEYRKTGKQLRGVWLEADQKLQQHIYGARSLQNSDGTFSTKYFDGPGYSNDFAERIETSGHTLEWLMMALPSERLSEEWVRRAAYTLATDIIEHRSDPVRCGALYHAVDALVLYRERSEEIDTAHLGLPEVSGRVYLGRNPNQPHSRYYEKPEEKKPDPRENRSARRRRGLFGF